MIKYVLPVSASPLAFNLSSVFSVLSVVKSLHREPLACSLAAACSSSAACSSGAACLGIVPHSFPRNELYSSPNCSSHCFEEQPLCLLLNLTTGTLPFPLVGERASTSAHSAAGLCRSEMRGIRSSSFFFEERIPPSSPFASHSRKLADKIRCPKSEI